MSTIYAMILFSFAVIAFFYATRVFYHKNYKKKTFLLFSLTAVASGVWSTGYACMQLVTEEPLFMAVRALGIVGLFAFLFFAQFLMGVIAEYDRKVFGVLGAELFLGIIICNLSIRPGSVKLIYSPKGIVTEFVNPLVSLLYTLFTLVVAAGFIAASIHMLNRKFMNNVRHFGRNLLIVEGVILVGMVVDTILPAMGMNLNIPASTMTQFVGLDILYHAVHKVDRNVVSVQNLAGYAYSSLKTPIMVFDYKNRMTIINQEARTVFDLSDKDIKRTDFLADAFGIGNPYDDRTEYATDVLEVQYTKDARRFQIYFDPIINEFDDFVGYIAMISDITEVFNYTRELEQAKNEATRANMAKSQFLANMSHEIRTPMNSILGFSELCLNDHITDESREYVTDIRDSAEILLAIINDILDISKIESGKMELVVDEYTPSLVFAEVNRVIEMQASKKDLYFQYEIEDGFPYKLKGDKTKIRAILINLLNNGIKYTNEGGVNLHIGFENYGNSKGRVKFVIKDTGIGIKKEDIGTIFNIFQRVDLSTNSSTEGTGLGLSITRGFIDLMGGTIEVDSEYGVGTTFTVSFDQDIIELEKPKLSENGIPMEEGKTLHLQNTKILAVDDTPLNLKLVNAMLSRYGASVELVQSGEAAIELCKQNEYDIVFMDQMMPVMDGVTAMREIRKIGNGYEQGGRRKIIALTANVIDGARDERIREGFDDFMGKPFNKRWMEIILVKYLDENQYYFEGENNR